MVTNDLQIFFNKVRVILRFFYRSHEIIDGSVASFFAYSVQLSLYKKYCQLFSSKFSASSYLFYDVTRRPIPFAIRHKRQIWLLHSF